MSLLFASGSAGMVSAFTTQPASAATLTFTHPHGRVTGNTSYKWTIGYNPGYKFTEDYYTKMYIDGKHVYCLQPNDQAYTGTTNYSGRDLAKYLGTGKASQKDDLELIAAFGYGYNGDTSDEMDYATQIKIWDLTNPGVVNHATVHADIKTKMNQIQKRIDDYNKTKDLSFEAVTETTQNKLGEYDITGTGEENAIILHDTTGTLTGNYSITSATKGFHAEKLSGDKIKIWVDEGTEFDDKNPGVISLNGFFNGKGASIAYISPTSQNVAMLDKPTGRKAQIKISHEESAPPTIGTKADVGGEKEINYYDDTFTLTDTVHYKGVVPGYKYTIKGELMNPDTEKSYGITAEASFTPTASEGEAVVTFDNVDVSKIAETGAKKSAKIVVYETLIQNTPSLGSSVANQEVANHKDKTDQGQTVIFNEPSVHTQATIDGTTTVNTYDKEVELKDTVTYENLAVGKEYTVKGQLINKATQQPVKEVTAKFTPKDKSGTTDVVFKVNPKEIGAGEFVVFETVYNNKGTEIAEHKDINDTDQTVVLKDASIGTTATIEGDKVINSKDKEVELKDTVSYKGLIPGKKYTLKGVVMDKETGKTTEYTSSTEFTPAQEEGSADMTFKINAKDVDGKTLVVFETLYDEKGNEVANHKDLTDTGQTVEIRHPEIKTSATIDGEKSVNAKASTVELVDTVSYEGLIPGNTYTVEGKLMDKDTGKELPTDGVTVQVEDQTAQGDQGEESATEATSKDANDIKVSSTQFIPESESGTVQVKWLIDLSKVKGKNIVVFETLKDKHEDEIAHHDDLSDEEQSVSIPEAKIHTKATINGAKEVEVGKTYELVDTVDYENLIPGKKYKMQGVLMDKSTGKALDSSAVKTQIIDDTDKTKSTDKGTSYFSDSDEEKKEVAPTAEQSEAGASSSVKYTVDGKTYQIKVSLDAEAIKAREAGNDFNATVSISGPNSSMNGTYTSKFTESTMKMFEALKTKDEKETSASYMERMNTFIQNVLDNQVKSDSKAGSKSTADVTAADDSKETSNASSTTFIPTAANGSVEVKFTVDTSKLAGKDVVVFEKLFDKNNDEIASHEDLNDTDQTVHIKERITNTPPTGIEAGITALAGLGALSAISAMKSRKKKEE